MKKIVFAIMLLFFVIHAYSQSTKEIRTYYDEITKKNLKEEYSVLDYAPYQTKEGKYKKYSRKGVLVLEESYKNGLRHGESRAYSHELLSILIDYDNDNKLWEKQYKVVKDKKTNIYISYLKAFWTYNKKVEEFQDVKVINIIEYYSNGKVSYDCAKDNGPCVGYHENGRKSSEVFYENKLLVGDYFEWFSDGMMKIEGQYVNGKRDGEWKEYYSDGAVKKRRLFTGGTNVSMFYYDRNGSVKEKREYNSEKVSVSEMYPNGNSKLTYSVLVYNGKKDGPLTTYYDTGEKESEVLLKAGKKNGYYKEWFRNGKLKTEGIYILNQGDLKNCTGKHGRWKHNNELGQFENVELYKCDNSVGIYDKFDVQLLDIVEKYNEFRDSVCEIVVPENILIKNDLRGGYYTKTHAEAKDFTVYHHEKPPLLYKPKDGMKKTYKDANKFYVEKRKLYDNESDMPKKYALGSELLSYLNKVVASYTGK